MHARTRVAVAGDAHAVTPELLGVPEGARDAFRAATERPALRKAIGRTRHRFVFDHLRRHSARSCPIQRLAELLIVLRVIGGASEAELRIILLFLDRVVADLCCGREVRSIDQLDVEEQAREAEENRLSLQRRIAESPEALEAEALAKEAESATQLEAARLLRRRARALRAGLGHAA